LTVYLPTACLALLELLSERRPAAQLLLADFDALPGVQMRGRSAPLVASQPGGGRTIDWRSYLECGYGEADVLFPTDFELLEALASSVGFGGRSMNTPVFLRPLLTDEELRETTTVSGFNPLLHEFPNTRFFVSGDTHDGYKRRTRRIETASVA
jgi:hypothetical protein